MSVADPPRASASGERFFEVYAATARINSERLRELDAILRVFESSGIEVLLLKGADLLGRAYGGVLGLRPMVDVDLLVHREDLLPIERLLGAGGFRSCVDGNPAYVSPTGVLLLDLVTELWYRRDIESIWKRSVPRCVFGRLRPALHPEDSLIHLVAYQTIHRGRLSPQMALDVAAFLDVEGGLIDWHRVVQEVTAWGLSLPLYHGLSYARDTGGAKVPSWVLDDLRPAASRRGIARLYRRLLEEREIPQLGHLLLVISRPGWGNKLQAVWKVFFPSREFLQFRYGTRTRWSCFGIRLIRPAHLVFRGGLLVWRMVRRLAFSRPV